MTNTISLTFTHLFLKRAILILQYEYLDIGDLILLFFPVYKVVLAVRWSCNLEIHPLVIISGKSRNSQSSVLGIWQQGIEGRCPAIVSKLALLKMKVHFSDGRVGCQQWSNPKIKYTLRRESELPREISPGSLLLRALLFFLQGFSPRTLATMALPL